jgi:hypothetical protein
VSSSPETLELMSGQLARCYDLSFILRLSLSIGLSSSLFNLWIHSLPWIWLVWSGQTITTTGVRTARLGSGWNNCAKKCVRYKNGQRANDKVSSGQDLDCLGASTDQAVASMDIFLYSTLGDGKPYLKIPFLTAVGRRVLFARSVYERLWKQLDRLAGGRVVWEQNNDDILFLSRFRASSTVERRVSVISC